MQTKNLCSIQRIVDTPQAMIPISFSLPRGYADRYRHQQFLLSSHPRLAKSTVYSSCCPQMTTVHRIVQSTAPFLGHASTVFGTDEYLAFTYVCNHCSDTPVTLAIPANDSLSNNNLSIKSLISCPITFLLSVLQIVYHSLYI